MSITFPANASRCLLTRIRKPDRVTEQEVACSQVKVTLDNTYQFLVFKVALDMLQVYGQAMGRFLSLQRKMNARTLELPVHVEEFVYGNQEFNFESFMTPGIVSWISGSGD